MGNLEKTGRELDQYFNDLTVFLNDVTDRLAALEEKAGGPKGRGDKTPPPPPGGGVDN